VDSIDTQFTILGGLPRSGITLLSALLNQHPEIYVTTTSPLVEILWRNYTVWTDDYSKDDCATKNIQQLKIPFLRKVITAYFSQLTDKPIVIDKRRQWQNTANLKMYYEIFGDYPKVIAPIRPVNEILGSYVKLFNHEEFNLEGSSFKKSFYDFKDGYTFGGLSVVEYGNLIERTQEVLDSIYSLLGASPFKNDLDNITPFEDESFHGIQNLHTIRNVVGRSDKEGVASAELLQEYEYEANWLQRIICLEQLKITPADENQLEYLSELLKDVKLDTGLQKTLHH